MMNKYELIKNYTQLFASVFIILRAWAEWINYSYVGHNILKFESPMAY